jgi:hypothetical protein
MTIVKHIAAAATCCAVFACTDTTVTPAPVPVPSAVPAPSPVPAPAPVDPGPTTAAPPPAMDAMPSEGMPEGEPEGPVDPDESGGAANTPPPPDGY